MPIERGKGATPLSGREEVDSALGEELSFRDKYPLVWWVTLLGPFVLTGAILLLVWQLAGSQTTLKLISTAAATFFLLGKFVILGGSNGSESSDSFFSHEQLLALVFYLDLMTAWLLSFHLSFIFRLPWIGKQIRALTEDGEFILKSNPWMRRATFWGLVAYVLLPLAATGAVGGAVFGRLLGMSPTKTFLGTSLGNLMSCVIAYFFGNVFDQVIDRSNPLLMAVGVAPILAVLWILNWRYRQIRKGVPSVEKGGQPSQTNSPMEAGNGLGKPPPC